MTITRAATKATGDTVTEGTSITTVRSAASARWQQASVTLVYWHFLSPMVHSTSGQIALIAIFTALFVLGPAYLPSGPLSFNVVP